MASIGPIGSAIYTNQQIATVASEKNALQNRFELQNMAAADASNAKAKEIEEVRPTEENHKVDEDREHTKQEAESENPKDRESKKEDEEANESPPLHRLDIKV
ncbi:MAG: hypothetical protein U9N52_03000 [Campylobacterota bacterium]|nr:hypothetical protein [Campylobacterota bacterium]